MTSYRDAYFKAYRDTLKSFIAANRESINDFDVCGLYNYLGGSNYDCRPTASKIYDWLTFSYICDAWTKRGFNPLTKINAVPTFYGTLSSATEIIIPKNCYEIEWRAFHQCANLKKIVISDAIAINEFAICDCPKLEEIEFCDRRNHVLSRWVANCQSLKRIIVPEGFEPSIGWLDGLQNVDIIFK